MSIVWRTLRLPVFACTALLALASNPSGAATVLSVGTIDLINGCDFIFHGRPVERWVTVGSTPDSIVTKVRFVVSDVLKGDPQLTTVVLSYLGGTANGVTLSIEGLQLPNIGDEGVYFVERLGRSQVHPLLGWDQGQFQVVTDSQGRKSVFTHDLRPVGRIEGVGAKWGTGTDHAPGVVVATRKADALSLDAFKTSIRNLVEQRQ